MPGVIHLQTEIPGPNSRALMARRAKAVPRGVPAVTPIAVAHAEGAMLTDADGNRLIDFGGGIGVVNTGHRHPGVVEAVREQLDRFAHVCFPVSTYEPYVELAERLNRLTPAPTRSAPSSSTAAPRRSRTRSRLRATSPGGRRCSASSTASTAAPTSRWRSPPR